LDHNSSVFSICNDDSFCGRRTSEDSDGDYFSRDSSSDGSSDSERDRGLTFSRGQQNHYIQPSEISLKMERLFLRDQHTALQEGFSSDEGEFGNPQGCLLFEYFEHDPPYCREPLADKVNLATSSFLVFIEQEHIGLIFICFCFRPMLICFLICLS